MQQEKIEKTGVKKKKHRKKRGFLYLYLFAFVFLIALSSFSYLVKSYSPDIDVSIGNNDSITLSDSDMDVEIKSVDERLKWIQMEDEMPTVALRNSEKQENPLNIDFLPQRGEENIEGKLRKNDDIKKKIIQPPTPTMSDIQISKPDFRTVSQNSTMSKGPIPLPSKPQNSFVPMPNTQITRVYLSNFKSLEDAMAVQQEISSRDKTIMPFIKVVDGKYILQLASFYDKEKAIALSEKFKEMGYSPKVSTSN